MRRTPLKRKTPLKSTSTLKRTAIRRKRKGVNELDFPPEVKRAVARRSGGKCEARTPVCREKATHHHHILMRGQGGPGTEENCLHVCLHCHDYIHLHPSLSYQRGWLIRGVQGT